MKKLIVQLLKKLEWGSALACRLTQLTGKANIPTHPKHLVDFGQLYYLSSLKSTDRVLDLGCHAGEHSFKAAPKVKQVIGLDINNHLISQAQKQAQLRQATNVKFLVHDLENKLPFPTNSSDKVFLFAVLEHLKNRNQALSEIRRVLKSPGTLFISVPNKNTTWKKLQQSVGLTGFADPDHKLEFSVHQISSLLTRHRFHIHQFQTTAIDTPLSGIIDLLGGLSLRLYHRLMLWKTTQGRLHPEDSVAFLVTASKL